MNVLEMMRGILGTEQECTLLLPLAPQTKSWSIENVLKKCFLDAPPP